MTCRTSRLLLGLGVLGAILLAPLPSAGQRTPMGRPTSKADSGIGVTASLRILVRDPSGGPIDMALVSLNMTAGGMFRQAITEVGQAEFDNLVPGLYSVEVVAAGYETVRETVNANAEGTMVQILLQASRDAASSGASGPPGLPVLSPKAQKLLAKAIEALRAGKPAAARASLEEAYRLAPGHPYVNYLYGVYASQMNDWPGAESYWQKALNIYPKHVGSLIFLSGALLRENRSAEAVPYLNRAIEAEPTSWRPHAMMAQALLSQKQYDDAIHQADRALELGHAQAAGVQPLLARALLAQGNRERAITVLQNYLRDHAGDSAAQKMLDSLRAPVTPLATPPAEAPPTEPLPPGPLVTSLPLSSAWMPPDVDEKVPFVERGVPCPLDDVLLHTSLRMTELVGNVDRFTATESLTHQRINEYGLPSGTELRTFNYLVSIGESSPGFLNVDEYRDGGPALEAFPGHIATLGLPSLVLLFHPLQAANFEFACEGLVRSGNGLSWMVHFQQKPDRLPTMRVYRTGSGRAFPIALKGRAWIAADSFQVVRLETDLVSPLPEIHLAGEHTAIEYGPVRFRSKDVSLWLPQTAEIYFDWRGQRVHRRHSFSNYILFSVDDKQRILPPKNEDKTGGAPAPHSSDPSAQSKQQPLLPP